MKFKKKTISHTRIGLCFSRIHFCKEMLNKKTVRNNKNIFLKRIFLIMIKTYYMYLYTFMWKLISNCSFKTHKCNTLLLSVNKILNSNTALEYIYLIKYNDILELDFHLWWCLKSSSGTIYLMFTLMSFLEIIHAYCTIKRIPRFVHVIWKGQ